MLALSDKTETPSQLAVARTAVGIAGDLAANALMGDAERAILRATVVDALGHPQWRMRLTALAVIHQTPFFTDADVAATIRRLRDDPEARVAKKARGLVLTSDPGATPDASSRPKRSAQP
ncbi:MAG: hypothetical protein ACKVS8_09580 [Phycisphaerales bacterium]